MVNPTSLSYKNLSVADFLSSSNVKYLVFGSAKEGTKTPLIVWSLSWYGYKSQQVTDTLGTSGALSNTKKWNGRFPLYVTITVYKANCQYVRYCM